MQQETCRFQGNIIYYNKRVETAQISINKRMDKSVDQIYTIEYSTQSEWTAVIYMYQHANMDEAHNHNGEQ